MTVPTDGQMLTTLNNYFDDLTIGDRFRSGVGR